MKQQLHAVMGWEGPMTHRQALCWSAWLSERDAEPDRHDWYAMQTAAEVRRVLHQRPADVKLDHFKIRFGPALPQPGGLTSEQLVAATKARWRAAMSVKGPPPPK